MVNGRIVSKKDQDPGPCCRFLRHEGPGKDSGAKNGHLGVHAYV